MSQEKHKSTATLLRMANQIAANMSAYAPEEASSRIALHLTRFWAPKMRQDLFAAAADAPDLSPLVRNAITIMQEDQHTKQIA